MKRAEITPGTLCMIVGLVQNRHLNSLTVTAQARLPLGKYPIGGINMHLTDPNAEYWHVKFPAPKEVHVNSVTTSNVLTLTLEESILRRQFLIPIAGPGIDVTETTTKEPENV